MSEERITLDMLGDLILNMQADLQVVSSAMLRLDRSIDRLRDEIQGMRYEMQEIIGGLRALHRQGLRTASPPPPPGGRCGPGGRDAMKLCAALQYWPPHG